MNKKLFFSALASTALLASCVENDLGSNDAQSGNADGRISFVKKNTNMTRAVENMEDKGHYEFGVWTYKGAAANTLYVDKDVMLDYLVAYGDNQTGTPNYKSLSANASTYAPDGGGADYTVTPDGLSTWFYEGLGNTTGLYKTSGANSIQPANTLQALKYWDKAEDYHNFFAYAPYFGHQAGETSNVALSVAASKNVLTYTGLTTFYTDPVVVPAASDAQVSSAKKEFAGTYTTGTAKAYNREITNANEGVYAAQSVEKTNYGKDVELTFKHINAKINVAIWEDIKGYKVALLDLVPADEAGHIANADIAKTTSLTGDKNLIPANGYKGVAFSPATELQAHNTAHQKESDLVVADVTPLPSYYDNAKTIATDIKQISGTTDRATISFGDGASDNTESSANLRFQTESNHTGTISNHGTTYTTISENGGYSASVLNTSYYALPNVKANNTDYITKVYKATSNYKTADTKVAENTGYTFHVSYVLIPEDGTAVTKVYDARVWVAPEYCKWQDGKQYTYIFKITKTSNGSTNPYASSDDIFGDGVTDQPYVDPDDPRVPEDPALLPIVFDGIQVADYETDVHTGKTNGTDEWQLSDAQAWKEGFLSGMVYKFTPMLYSAADFKSALSDKYSAVSPALTASYDGNTRTFSIGSMKFGAAGMETHNISGSDINTSATFASISGEHGDVTSIAKTKWNSDFGAGNVTFAKYTMDVWTNTAGSAEKYTATPAGANKVTVTSTITQMFTTTTYAGYCYKIVTKDYNVTPAVITTKYYRSSDDAEITEAAYDLLVAAATGASVSPADTYDYSFSYKYSVATDGYTVTTGASTPNLAYGIATYSGYLAYASQSDIIFGTGGTATLYASEGTSASTTGTWVPAGTYTGITLSTTSGVGAVTVDTTTPAGSYTFLYQVSGTTKASTAVIVK